MLEVVLTLALVAIGSGLGGVARFVVSVLVARAAGEAFPWGTLVVNVSGSFAVGVLAQLLEVQQGAGWPALWPLAAVGFLGSYTTVSSFSFQTLALARNGARSQAAMNVVLSLVLCLAAVALGLIAGQAALPAPA